MVCVHVGVHLPALAHAWACKQYVFWTAHVFVCVCVGECAPACLPACRPACVRACLCVCVRAPGCGCVHELACQLMSPVIQQWACCGLVAGSRGWESHSRLQLSLAARKEGCRLSPAVSPPQPQGVIVAVGLCFGLEFSTVCLCET